MPVNVVFGIPKIFHSAALSDQAAPEHSASWKYAPITRATVETIFTGTTRDAMLNCRLTLGKKAQNDDDE